MKRRLLPLLLSLCLLCSFLPAAAAAEGEDDEEASSVTALCVAWPGETVSLDLEELQQLCRKETGHDLESVSFSYVYFGDFTCGKDSVAPKTPYYMYESPQLSQIRFTPFTRFTGQKEISFTMTSEEDETVDGTMIFYVPEETVSQSGDVSFSKKNTFSSGGPAPLLDLFSFYRSSEDDLIYYGKRPLSFLTFDLPSGNQGYLWLNYDYSDARKLLPGERLQPDGDPSFYDLTLVPADEAVSQVRLRYHVGANEEFISLRFRKETASSTPSPSTPRPEPEAVIDLSAGLDPIDLSQPFYQACAPLTPGRPKSITFLFLPTAGEGSILSAGVPVSAGTSYPYDTLTFAPGPAFQGNLRLRYAGVDDEKNSFAGALNISLDMPFEDLRGWEWAVPAAQFLRAHGFDTQETAFRPGENASRMELICALVRTAYSDDGSTSLPAFSDLPADGTLARAAAVAAAHGLVLGDGENRLLPDASITRQDALVILYRAMTDLNILPAGASGDLSAFSDAEALAPYAREAAAALQAQGVLLGDGSGRLAPLSPITRAEMAGLLYRAFS